MPAQEKRMAVHRNGDRGRVSFVTVAARLSAVVVSVVALAWTASATAQATSYGTTIGYSGPFSADDFQGIYYGTVTSEKRACVGGRQVKLYLVKNGSLKLVDTVRTSKGGAWAAHGYAFVEGKVTVTPAKLGKNGTCKGATLVLD